MTGVLTATFDEIIEFLEIFGFGREDDRRVIEQDGEESG